MNDFEMQMIEMSIKFHKKHCNMFLLIMLISAAFIPFAFTLFYFHIESYWIMISVGMMIMNFAYCFQQWSFTKNDLRFEQEKKNVYEKLEINDSFHENKIPRLK